jgi:hypothetical protein
MPIRKIALFLLAGSLSASAEPRTWKSADGSKTFQGEFINREGVKITVQPVGGKEVTFDIGKLHPDDQKWVNLYHPMDGSKKSELQESNGVFDELEFGDTRQQVYEKLKVSKLVEPVGKETIFGNTAMDGGFRTKQAIGELHASLFFTWGDDGNLVEISLQTDPLGGISYDDSLKMCWENLIEILSTFHGEPVQSAPYPPRNQIQESQILCSHVWRLEKGGTAMLGTSQATGGKYMVVVRFSKKTVEEVQRFVVGKP